MPNATKILGDLADRNPSDAQLGIISPTPVRLTGVLAKDETVLDGITKFERVQVAGVIKVYVLVKVKLLTGTLTVNGYPMLSDANKLDTTGTRKPIGLPTALTITVGADPAAQEMEFTGKGEEYLDIEFVMSGGGSDTVTIEYVEVYGI